MNMFYFHNKVPQNAKRYLGWENESVGADEVLLYYAGDISQDSQKRVKIMKTWLNAMPSRKVRFIPSSDATVMAIMPMAHAAIMRLELSI